MGNSGGNLQDYWDVIERYPALQGGFIWEWADQGLLYTNDKGLRYKAYGHDYHPDLPTDGCFINKGLVDGLRQPVPHYWEAKKVYQPFEIRKAGADDVYTIKNKYAFSDLSHFNLHWELTSNGQVVRSGDLPAPAVAPGQSATFQLPVAPFLSGPGEFLIKIAARTNRPLPLLPTGFEAGFEQFALENAGVPSFEAAGKGWPLVLEKNLTRTDETGRTRNIARISSPPGPAAGVSRMRIEFDAQTGDLLTYVYNGVTLLTAGPRPNFWRAPTDNDLGNKMHQWANVWQDAGHQRVLEQFFTTQIDSSTVNVIARYRLPAVQAALELHYRIFGDGTMHVSYHYQPDAGQNRPKMPRVGVALTLPDEFQFVEWYGRGPHESYQDRKTSAAIGLYKGRVWDQFYAYTRPQESGNKCDVRRMRLINEAGAGLEMHMDGEPLSCSAWPFAQDDLDFEAGKGGEQSASGLVPNVSKHGADVFPRDFITWNIDLQQMGVGGDNSWGAPVHEQYTIRADIPHAYAFWLKPVTP
jgi:beta-galactosidase